MIPLVTALLGVAGQSLKSWFDSRAVEREATFEIKKIEAQARVEQARSLALVEAEYDTIAQQNMRFTWKDEYLMVIFTTPFIVSFGTPYLQLLTDKDLVTPLREAWSLVATAPDWYQWAILGMIIATYGLRWAAGGFKLPGRKRNA